MSASQPFNIGIDLGTTYSCVAIYKQNSLHTVPNENGHATTPSMVYFGDESGKVIVGETAKNKLKSQDGFRSICYNSKRLLGKTYSQFNSNDVITAEVVNCGGYPYYKVVQLDEEKEYSPSQISGHILDYMKKIAETYKGKPVDGAVITVPAYFSDIQRRETEEAARQAHLNVIHIINEPTAAAIAYNFDNCVNTNIINNREIILVYDLGGGTFDISLVSKEYDNHINKNILKIIGTSGDNHLGGDDFDQKLLEYYINKSQEYEEDMFVLDDGSEDKKKKMKLKLALQKAKEFLNDNNMIVNLDFESFDDLEEELGEGTTGLTTLSRALFEDLNKETFEKTMEITLNLLNTKNMTVNNVDQVLLCGGSTRIEYIKKRLRELFGERKIKEIINPDEIVARGACILAQYPVEEIPTIVQDLIPRNLGLKIRDERRTFDIVVDKFTSIPFNITRNYETTEDDQEYANFVLYEGDSLNIAENIYLGHFTITDLPRGRAGQVQFQVTFSYGFDGMLRVKASTGTITEEITIHRNMLD